MILLQKMKENIKQGGQSLKIEISFVKFQFSQLISRKFSRQKLNVAKIRIWQHIKWNIEHESGKIILVSKSFREVFSREIWPLPFFFLQKRLYQDSQRIALRTLYFWIPTCSFCFGSDAQVLFCFVFSIYEHTPPAKSSAFSLRPHFCL